MKLFSLQDRASFAYLCSYDLFGCGFFKFSISQNETYDLLRCREGIIDTVDLFLDNSPDILTLVIRIRLYLRSYCSVLVVDNDLLYGLEVGKLVLDLVEIIQELLIIGNEGIRM